MEQTPYIAIAQRIIRRRGCTWVYPPGSDSPLPLDLNLAGVLLRLEGSRSLEDHYSLLSEGIGQSMGSGMLRSALKRLIELDLLVPCDEVINKIVNDGLSATGISEPPPITSVGIITAGSVQCHAVKKFSGLRHEREKAVQVVVCDDRGPALVGSPHRGSNTSSDIRRWYFGLAERRKFLEVLFEESGGSIDKDIFEFTLFGDQRWAFRAGANRNAFLLARAGELLLMSDDDEGCDYARFPDAKPGIAFSSRMEAAQLHPFPSLNGAFEFAGPVQHNLLDLHTPVLGRFPADYLSAALGRGESIDLAEAGTGLIDSLVRYSPSVAATTAGVLGDSGMGFPHGLLYLAGEARERMMVSRQCYRDSIVNRTVYWAAGCHIVTDAPFFRTGHSGYDTRRLLPPFPPFSTDGPVWAQLLSRCYPPGCIAHLPAAVLHRPSSPRHFLMENLSELKVRASDVISLVLQLLPQTALFPLTPESALVSLGVHLESLGKSSSKQYRDVLHEAWLRKASSEIERSEELLAFYSGSPDYWASDMQALINAYEASIRRGIPDIMTDCTARSSDFDGYREARHHLLRFGTLLRFWPEIFRIARKLRDSGYEAAVPWEQQNGR